MNKIHWVLMVVAMMVLWCTGCGNGGRVDPRLAAIDSIVDRDSVAAWQQLQAIDSAALTTEVDRALYALLHQQLRYKQYLPLDTTVLATLREYYGEHSAGNHFTRTLLLIGAAAEDAGAADVAITWYKRTETDATEKADTFFMAFSKLRIAKAFEAAYSDDSISIMKFKECAPLFRAIGSPIYECVSLTEAGGLYRLHDLDSAYYYLTKAQEVAKEMNDTSRIIEITSHLSGYYFMLNDFKRSKDLAVSAINRGMNIIPQHILIQAYNNAAFAYAKLGEADSALYYIHAKPASPQPELDEMNEHYTMSLIAQSKGDVESYITHNKREDEIADSVLLASMYAKVREAETKYDKTQAELEASRAKWRLTVAIAGMVVLAVFAMLLIYFFIQREKRLEAQMELLHSELAQSQELVSRSEHVSDEMKETVRQQLTIMNEQLSTYYLYSHNAAQFMRHFKGHIDNFLGNEAFWDKLMNYVNETHNGLIDRITTQAPHLGEKNLKFVCLDCLGFEEAILMLLMGYNNKRSVANRRTVIAHQLEECGIDYRHN